MSNKKQKTDNPQAFPQAQFRGDEQVDTAEHGGMTLRDYFAAKAMQSLLSDHEVNSSTRENISEFAYKYADAMLEERQNK